MPVPRRRHSKARVGRGRTHKKLFASQLTKCSNPDCGEMKMPHRICPKCGTYAGRKYREAAAK